MEGGGGGGGGVDAESEANDMFEVDNHLTWCGLLNFNQCTVR